MKSDVKCANEFKSILFENQHIANGWKEMEEDRMLMKTTALFVS